MYVRAMTPDSDGGPCTGRSGRHLGVRVPRDIAADSANEVHRGTGGMSVTPEDMWRLPHHRRPRGMGRGSSGPAIDRVYSLLEGSFEQRGLAVRPDPQSPEFHAFVEPRERMPLSRYEGELANTRTEWSQVWP